MSYLNYLTKEIFFATAIDIGSTKGGELHWKHLDERWDYHSKATNALKSLDVSNPNKVLEMGTMGVQLIENSHTIDYMGNESWNYDGKNPTYIHDAKSIPWPIQDKKYECFVALRVFQHLQPYQKEAFLEAKRVASSIVLVVPEENSNYVSFTKPKTITLKQLVEWNDGIKPDMIEKTKMGNLYLFKFKDG